MSGSDGVRALEQLRAEEESQQLGLFVPTPEELKAAEELRTQADDLLFKTFYRVLKARSHDHVNAAPIQISRCDTVDHPHDKRQSLAPRAWNIGSVLYYKSGGLSWRPAYLPVNTCFVGISFHHLKKRTGSLVYASMAQAFSMNWNNTEGLSRYPMTPSFANRVGQLMSELSERSGTSSVVALPHVGDNARRPRPAEASAPDPQSICAFKEKRRPVFRGVR